MSLKDRLNANNTQTKKIVEIEEELNEPKYYETSEIAQKSSSLGAIDPFLADDDINSIFVNGAKNIFIERNKKLHKSTTTYRDDVQLENLIKKITKNNDEQYIKVNHKKGINLILTKPPLTNNLTMFVKCYKDKFATFENLENQKVLSKEVSLFLEALIQKKANILIAGAKNTFKTTLVSALIKKIQTNNRYVLLDFSSEIEIDKPNFTNFNLSDSKNKEFIDDLINTTVNSNPEKIFLNDCPYENLNSVIDNAINGFKGFVLNVDAQSKEEAIEKIIILILKNYPSMNYELAKIIAYKAFDFIIFAEEKEERKIKSVSEIANSENVSMINDIFLVDENKRHYSTGYLPSLFLEESENLINLNIFNNDYIHTYIQTVSNEEFEKKGLNPEILKKFKKDFAPVETVEKTTETEPENKLQNEAENEMLELQKKADEELMKRAQEKFDEIKRNLKNNELES